MTMRYVHHVEEHHRPIPEEILAAGSAVTDPDSRIIAMLGTRSAHGDHLRLIGHDVPADTNKSRVAIIPTVSPHAAGVVLRTPF
jgi:hypothetical protein